MVFDGKKSYLVRIQSLAFPRVELLAHSFSLYKPIVYAPPTRIATYKNLIYADDTAIVYKIQQPQDVYKYQNSYRRSILYGTLSL